MSSQQFAPKSSINADRAESLLAAVLRADWQNPAARTSGCTGEIVANGDDCDIVGVMRKERLFIIGANSAQRLSHAALAINPG